MIFLYWSTIALLVCCKSNSEGSSIVVRSVKTKNLLHHNNVVAMRHREEGKEKGKKQQQDIIKNKNRELQFTGEILKRWTLVEPEYDFEGSDLNLFYELSDYINSDMVRHEVYVNSDCSEGHDNEFGDHESGSMTVRENKRELDGSGDGQNRNNFIVSFKLGSKIRESTLYSSVSNEDKNGIQTDKDEIITFCSKVTIYDGPVEAASEVNSVEILVTLRLDSEIKPIINETKLILKGSNIVMDDEKRGYVVEAYECDQHDNEIISTVPKHKGEEIRICITPDYEAYGNDVRMRTIESMNFTAGTKSNFTQFSVDEDSDTISNGFSEVNCEFGLAVCSVETMLKPDLFTQQSGTIYVSGVVTLAHFGMGPFQIKTSSPTFSPTISQEPTIMPTEKPTEAPHGPTITPTKEPNSKPTLAPSQEPTDKPRIVPTPEQTQKLTEEEKSDTKDKDKKKGNSKEKGQHHHRANRQRLLNEIHDEHTVTFHFTFEATNDPKKKRKRDDPIIGNTEIVQPHSYHIKEEKRSNFWNFGGNSGDKNDLDSSSSSSSFLGTSSSTSQSDSSNVNLTWDVLSSTNFLIFVGVVLGLLACNFFAFLVWLCCCRKNREDESRTLLVSDQNHQQIRRLV